MTEIAVTGFSDLVKAAFALRKEHGGIWWYRGHACADWRLMPSIRRKFPAWHERNMVAKFLLDAQARRSDCPSPDDWPAWLCLMRHYGLPTRLLDWSESLLTAIFFAARFEECEGPAAVWALRPARLNASQTDSDSIMFVDRPECGEVAAPAFTKQHETGRTYAAYAPPTDLRMLLQQAAYTLHGSGTPIEEMAGAESFVWKIVIAEEAKKPVAETVMLLGARRRDLFPDLASLSVDIVDEHEAILRQEKKRGNGGR